MKVKLITSKINFNSKEIDCELPEYYFKNFKIRIGTFEDLEEIATISYPGMAIDLSDEKFMLKAKQGLVFEKETNGFIFVVVENEHGQIVGRSYIKSWHVDYFKKPRFALRNNSILIANAAQSFNGTKILEVGGVVIDEKYQRQGLGSSLLYARLKMIEYFYEELHLPINAIMITNVGPFRAKDNSRKIEFGEKIIKKLLDSGKLKSNDYNSAMDLVDQGQVISKTDFFECLKELKVLDEDYFYGAPRDASRSAYNNSIRICKLDAILYDNDELYFSPYQFKKSECIHFDHGGSYFVYNFV